MLQQITEVVCVLCVYVCVVVGEGGGHDSYSIEEYYILIIASSCRSLRYEEIQCHVLNSDKYHSLFIKRH